MFTKILESCTEQFHGQKAPFMQKVYWVLPDVIAGRCGPEMAPWDCWDLYAGGIRGIVSLSEPVDEQKIGDADIQHCPLYFPAMLLTRKQDFKYFLSFVPRFLDFMDAAVEAGNPVMVHCTYGCDRTGAMLSIYLIARHGYSAESAIAKVRTHQPRAMSATGYEDVVYHFVDMVNGGEKKE